MYPGTPNDRLTKELVQTTALSCSSEAAGQDQAEQKSVGLPSRQAQAAGTAARNKLVHY